MIGPILKPILEGLRQYFVQPLISNFDHSDTTEYSTGQGPSKPALGITETCKFHYHGIATCPRLFSIRPLFTKFSKIMEVKCCKVRTGQVHNLINKCTGYTKINLNAMTQDSVHSKFLCPKHYDCTNTNK